MSEFKVTCDISPTISGWLLVLFVVLFSALLSISIASESAHGTELLPEPSVCASVRRVSCGKMAGWIWMPFGVVSWVGRGMGVFGGDRRRGRGSLGSEFVASHCK